MAVRAVVFDVGETLVDETRQYALRERGATVGAAGNMARANEGFIAPHSPWGHLHETPPGARVIDSLLELVE